jgi:heme/copper-type cytochrome/quinol oxidase subunit 4
MAFSSCDNIDKVLGFALMFIAFLLSVFTIQAYNKLDDNNKSTEGFQFTFALITLIISIVYFLYMIKDPVVAIINKRK